MRRAIAFAILILVSTAVAEAQTSTTRLIPYSGTALDAGGTPLTGPITLVLELFEEQHGGAPLWRETQHLETDDRGRYLVYLGAVTTIPQIAFSEERARWLAVAVEGRSSPRVMLVAVPYAFRAADADTLSGQPASAFMRSRADGRLETAAGTIAESAVEGSGIAGQIAKFTSATTLGSSVISESASNRVGFGLTDPTGGGVVDSVFTIRNFDNNTGFGILNQANQRRFAINTLFTGGWAIYDGGSSVWNQGLSQVNGNVGIGTTAPVSKFTVRNQDRTLGQLITDSAMGLTMLNPTNQRRFALSTEDSGGFTLYDGADNIWRPGLMQLRGNAGVDAAGGARFHIYNRQESPGQILPTSPNGLRVDNLRFGGTGMIVSATQGPGALIETYSFAPGSVLTLRTESFVSDTLLVLENRDIAENTADFFRAGTESASLVRIDSAGKVFANGGFQTGGADFAEEIEPADAAYAYERGDVLVIGSARDRTVARSHGAYATTVIGVYSTQPGVTASPYVMDDPRRQGKLPVAMIGIVPCKVSAENGAIERGDLLVTSSTPGHAMRGTDRARITGAIVGKAMEPLTDGTGTILIAVTLQ